MTALIIRNRLAVIAAVIAIAATAAVLLGRTPAASVALPDGNHHVRIVSQTNSGTVTLDPVDVLSGEEAVEAAVTDGSIQPWEDLPNDVYIREGSTATVPLPLAVTANVEVYDCTSECAPTRIDRDTFLAGDARPLNGQHAIFDATVSDGQIVSLTEIYLP